MRSIVLYMHMHQPYRVKHYNIFEVGHDHDYWNDKDWHAGTNNERIFKKVAEKSYRPMLARLEKCIQLYEGFKFSLSITGTFLEQAEAWGPDIIETLKRLTASGRVEIIAETYYHSLAFFYDRAEFEAQIRQHQAKIRDLFGVETRVLRNTELSYNNELARWADDFGMKGILAEGWDKVLEWRSPNFVYRPEGCKNIKLLLKNYRLSDDIAFRFSDRNWKEWPLTVDKYIQWLETATLRGPLINLFMDFETFGENIWEDTGIFEFFEHLVYRWDRDSDNNFLTVSEACDSAEPKAEISMPWTVTWADTERDLTAWLGNSMQHEALKGIYDLKESVLKLNNPRLTEDWRRLQTSDHPYYMCTKYFSDGDVHAYFSPYDSPFDAFLYYMNTLRDMRGRIDELEAHQKAISHNLAHEQFYLETPSLKRKPEALAMIEEFREYESPSIGFAGLDEFDGDYEAWLEQRIDKKRQNDTEDITAETFFLVRKSDDRLIGAINIRLNLNERLKKYGGNISYSIRPTERGKGYNKINLYLGLQKCQEFGFKKVVLDVMKSNIASWKTIEALGGEQIGEFYHPDKHGTAKKYQIHIAKALSSSQDAKDIQS